VRNWEGTAFAPSTGPSRLTNRSARKSVPPSSGSEGPLPENVPPAEPIKVVEKRLKSARPKLVLDGLDAKGLLGDGGTDDAVVDGLDESPSEG